MKFEIHLRDKLLKLGISCVILLYIYILICIAEKRIRLLVSLLVVVLVVVVLLVLVVGTVSRLVGTWFPSPILFTINNS